MFSLKSNKILFYMPLLKYNVLLNIQIIHSYIRQTSNDQRAHLTHNISKSQALLVHLDIYKNATLGE